MPDVKKPTLNVPSETKLPSDTEDERPSDSKRHHRTKNNNNPVELELNILLKFIKPYDGNRETLNSFIINCNNAYDIATETQKPIVFKYILCQLSGKAEVACSIKEFISWEQLKEFLKTQFSVRKHYSHLLTELQECRQAYNENVTQFSLKIEICLSQLLTEISQSNCKLKEIPGRTAAMEDLALHHFLMGLLPRLSNIVRCKSPRTLNEAINFAVSEERIQETIYKRNNENKIKKPNLMSNIHNPRSRTFTPQPPQVSQTNESKFNNNTNYACRYCKTLGHTIENCKKREYNNNRFRYQQKPSPRVNFVHEPYETDEGEDTVDNNDDSLNDQMSRPSAARD